MTSVLLIYPFFQPAHDRSIFRFPPLGLGYLAANLRRCGYDPQLLDCTFLERAGAPEKALEVKADVVGIYSMVTMREESLWFAHAMRDRCGLLVAGGPLPSCDPGLFLDDFDIVVIGEGEWSMPAIVGAYEKGSDLRSIPGIAYRKEDQILFTDRRELEGDLDGLAFPARDLFPNREYIGYWRKRFGQATTTVMTTRGCPFFLRILQQHHLRNLVPPKVSRKCH